MKDIRDDKSLIAARSLAQWPMTMSRVSILNVFLPEPLVSVPISLLQEAKISVNSKIINFRQPFSSKESLHIISWFLIYKDYSWFVLCTVRGNLSQDALYRHTFFGGVITENEILTRWLATVIQKGSFGTSLLETKAKVK